MLGIFLLFELLLDEENPHFSSVTVNVNLVSYGKFGIQKVFTFWFVAYNLISIKLVEI